MHWLLKGMRDRTLIGLLDVMPKTHLRVIKLLKTKSFIRRHNSNIAHKATSHFRP